MISPTLPTGCSIADVIDAINRRERVRLYINFPEQHILFEDDDIAMDGGITLSQIINANENVGLGCSSSAELTVHLLKSTKTETVNWEDHFSLQCIVYNVTYGNPQTTTNVSFPLGAFVGEKPKSNPHQNVIEFKAHDRTILLDENADVLMNTISFPATLQYIAVQFQNYFNWGTGFIGATDMITPNGNEAWKKSYDENPFPKGSTFRQILTKIASFSGGNLFSNAWGGISLRWFRDVTSDYALTMDHYFDIDMSEEQTSVIDKIEIVENDRNSVLSYPSTGGNEIYRMTDNQLPFFQTDDYYTTQQYLQALYNRLNSFPTYFPMKVVAEGNPLLEVGDIFSVEYMPGEYTNMPIFSKTLHYNGGLTAEYECTGTPHRSDNEFAEWTPGVVNGVYDYVKQSTLDDAINGTFYTLSPQRTIITIDDQSCVKVGCVVIGHVRFTTTGTLSANNYVLNGLPHAKTTLSNGYSVAACPAAQPDQAFNVANANSSMAAIITSTALPAGTYIVAFSYISDA